VFDFASGEQLARGGDMPNATSSNGANERTTAILVREDERSHPARVTRRIVPRNSAIRIRRSGELEYQISRLLCDARILNIFEGAAEIQAQVIARRLLEGGN